METKSPNSFDNGPDQDHDLTKEQIWYTKTVSYTPGKNDLADALRALGADRYEPFAVVGTPTEGVVMGKSRSPH